MREETKNYVKKIQKVLENYARRFPRGHWFLLPCFMNEVVRHIRQQTKLMLGSDCGEIMQNFNRSGHPIFRSTSTLEGGQVRSKGGGRTTTHFTASDDNVQLLLKMVISVNQLSLCGAVADMMKKVTWRSNSCRETCCIWSYCRSTSQWRATGKLVAKLRAKIWKTIRRPEISQIVFRSKFEFGRSWTILLCSSVTKWSEELIFMPRIHVSSRRKGKLRKRVDRKRCTIGPCHGHKGLQNSWKIQRWNFKSIFIRRSNHFLD